MGCQWQWGVATPSEGRTFRVVCLSESFSESFYQSAGGQGAAEGAGLGNAFLSHIQVSGGAGLSTRVRPHLSLLPQRFCRHSASVAVSTAASTAARRVVFNGPRVPLSANAEFRMPPPPPGGGRGGRAKAAVHAPHVHAHKHKHEHVQASFIACSAPRGAGVEAASAATQRHCGAASSRTRQCFAILQNII